MYQPRPVRHAEILRRTAHQREHVPAGIVFAAADAVERAVVRERVLVAMLCDISRHLRAADSASAVAVLEEARVRGFTWWEPSG